MIDTEKQVKAELKNYTIYKNSIKNIPVRIRLLRESLTGFGVNYENTKVQKTTDCDQRIVDVIDEIDLLEKSYQSCRARLELMDRAIACLPQSEREILTCYYLERNGKPVFRLAQELNIGETQVYRRQREAVKLFAGYMYGPQQ